MDRLTNINIEKYKINKEIIDSTPPEFVELHEKIKNNILKRLELETKTFENELRKIKWFDVDKLKEKLSKLAEYENTNLTPQEVLDLQNEVDGLLGDIKNLKDQNFGYGRIKYLEQEVERLKLIEKFYEKSTIGHIYEEFNRLQEENDKFKKLHKELNGGSDE